MTNAKPPLAGKEKEPSTQHSIGNAGTGIGNLTGGVIESSLLILHLSFSEDSPLKGYYKTSGKS